MTGGRPALVGLLAVVALAAAACGSGSTASAPTTGSTPPAASSTAPAVPTPGPTAAPAPPSTPAAPAVSACVARTLDALTPEQRAAQLVMVGVPATDPASGADLVASTGVGGVFLQGRSTAPVETVAAEVAALQQASPAVPLLVSADVEGGQVQTLSGLGIGQVPTAVVQGASPATLGSVTRRWADAVRRAGVTLDLAPVADVVPPGTAADNPPIGVFDRQYGSDPATVADAVATVVTAAQDVGLLTTAKHFPGLGRVAVNTDTATGATDPGDLRTDGSLEPFRAAVRAGTAAVMVSSASYPRLDPDDLALFSRAIVTDLLRGPTAAGGLGFDGLVLTDDVGAAVAVADVPPAQRATRFLAAGGDVVLTVATSDVAPVVAALAAPELAERVAVSVRRVLAAKERARLLRC
ncbi:glycoside hydrolase family 3 protein [Rhodococcus aerolatus]